MAIDLRGPHSKHTLALPLSVGLRVSEIFGEHGREEVVEEQAPRVELLAYLKKLPDALRIVSLGKIANRPVAHLVDMRDAAVPHGNLIEGKAKLPPRGILRVGVHRVNRHHVGALGSR